MAKYRSQIVQWDAAADGTANMKSVLATRQEGERIRSIEFADPLLFRLIDKDDDFTACLDVVSKHTDLELGYRGVMFGITVKGRTQSSAPYLHSLPEDHVVVIYDQVV